MSITNKEISRALAFLRPNAEWVLRGDDYDNLEWLDSEQSAPAWSEVQNEISNPTPKPEPTIEEKLSSVGLSVQDLKSALGLE